MAKHVNQQTLFGYHKRMSEDLRLRERRDEPRPNH